MNRTFLLAAAAAATVLVLTGCGSPAEEPAPQAELPARAVRVVTAEEAKAYKDRLPNATKASIASIMLEAPNEELRLEAQNRRDELFKKP